MWPCQYLVHIKLLPCIKTYFSACLEHALFRFLDHFNNAMCIFAVLFTALARYFRVRDPDSPDRPSVLYLEVSALTLTTLYLPYCISAANTARYVNRNCQDYLLGAFCYDNAGGFAAGKGLLSTALSILLVLLVMEVGKRNADNLQADSLRRLNLSNVLATAGWILIWVVLGGDLSYPTYLTYAGYVEFAPFATYTMSYVQLAALLYVGPALVVQITLLKRPRPELRGWGVAVILLVFILSVSNAITLNASYDQTTSLLTKKQKNLLVSAVSLSAGGAFILASEFFRQRDEPEPDDLEPSTSNVQNPFSNDV